MAIMSGKNAGNNWIENLSKKSHAKDIISDSKELRRTFEQNGPGVISSSPATAAVKISIAMIDLNQS